MKKPLTLLVSLAFLGGSLSFPAYGAAKAGSTCSKAGTTSVVSGKKYVCIKSGKKLTWDKGEALAKPTAAPTSPATSSPSPSTSTIPALKYPDAPTGFEDLVKNYEGISYAAWSKSRAKILQSSKTDLNFRLVLGANSKLTNKNPNEAFELVSRLYSGFAKSGNLYLLAFNFEDRDWAVKQMESIVPNTASAWIYDIACPSKENCIGGGSFTDGLNNYLVVETMGLVDDNTTSGTLEAHEFAHLVQQMSMGAPRPPVEYLSAPWFPNWYWEGQANFSQNASIWFDSYESYLQRRRYTSGGLFGATKYDSQLIEEYFVLNPNKEWGAKHARYRQYDLGAMFIEILVALKGPDSTMEMWKLAGTGVGIESAFEKIYGIPFKTALPIMSKAIALELGRK
jgi:hypothetical protein